MAITIHDRVEIIKILDTALAQNNAVVPKHGHTHRKSGVDPIPPEIDGISVNLNGIADGQVIGYVGGSEILAPLSPSFGAPVSSVFGRIGAVVAAVGDYLASQITNDSSVSGATVKDALYYLESRAVPSHLLGSASHGADTLANLNTKITDANLDDVGAPRPPSTHTFGGSAHGADLLANINALITDANLDDSGDTRPTVPDGTTITGAGTSGSPLVATGNRARTTVSTATYTALSTDQTLAIQYDGPVTITLPDSELANDGRMFSIADRWRKSASVNNITVKNESGDVIAILNASGSEIDVISDTVEWS